MMQLSCPNCGEKDKLTTGIVCNYPDGMVLTFDFHCITCGSYWNKEDKTS